MTPEHQKAIDQALERVAQAEKARLSTVAIRDGAEQELSVEALRQSKLGQALVQLAQIAEQGLGTLSTLEARKILDEVYAVFCQAPGHEYPLIPPEFDKTPLGIVLNRARSKMLGIEDIVNVAEAARLTGVARGFIYTLITGGIIHPIEMNDRTMVERRELSRVEAHKEKGA